MQQEIKGNVEIYDLTLESDEEEKRSNEKAGSPLIEISNIEDEYDDNKSEEDESEDNKSEEDENGDNESEEDESDDNESEEDLIGVIDKKTASSQQNGKECFKQSSESEVSRDVYMLLEKAVEEIRKGGSLVLTALQYGIPENVIYKKLVSRDLPDVTTLLTRAEEENLVRWILLSNECNTIVLKKDLMEKVGKLKKVSRITQFFHKSKYGREWYFNFLSSHPEIYENEGVLLKCDSKIERRRPVERSINENTKDELILNKKCKNEITAEEIPKEESIETENVIENLMSSYNIKEAVVILHDCKKQMHLQDYYNEKENMSTQIEENKPVNHSLVHNIGSTDPTQPNRTNSTGKHISNILSKYKRKRCGEKNKKTKPTCKICSRTFYDNHKLTRHVLTIHPVVEHVPATCKECSKIFKHKYRLEVHMRLAHGVLYHTCSYCTQVFKHRKSLNRHCKVKHESRKQQHECDSPSENFVCDICKKSFNHKSSLKEHIIYRHLKQKGKHICNVCGKGFIKPSILNKHRKTHVLTENLFFCSNCDKRFSRKYLLREHLEKCSEKNVEQECDKISKECLKEMCLD